VSACRCGKGKKILHPYINPSKEKDAVVVCTHCDSYEVWMDYDQAGNQAQVKEITDAANETRARLEAERKKK
jgi:hypothetical protein